VYCRHPTGWSVEITPLQFCFYGSVLEALSQGFFSNIKLKTNQFFFSFYLLLTISDAHNPVVDWYPGQIMAQFFATRGELTVLVS
jgi:hypothetical protein